MEAFFGQTLIKYKSPEPVAEAPAPTSEEPPKPETPATTKSTMPQYCESVPLTSCIPAETKYIGVLFVSNFPQCSKLSETFHQFCSTLQSQGPEFKFISVICDEREKDFCETLKQFSWLPSLPFETP